MPEESPQQPSTARIKELQENIEAAKRYVRRLRFSILAHAAGAVLCAGAVGATLAWFCVAVAKGNSGRAVLCGAGVLIGAAASFVCYRKARRILNLFQANKGALNGLEDEL